MKCNVCGKLFIIKNQNRYLTVEPTTLSNSLDGGGAVYDTFDCPRCGCQHRVSIRYRELNPVAKTEQKDVQASNSAQAEYLLNEINRRFDDQNKILDEQNRMLERLIELMEK